MTQPISNPAKHKLAYFGFCKRIVNDLEKQAEFYKYVFDLEELVRHQSERSAVTGGPIAEINFRPAISDGSILVLLKMLDREAPARGEMILGMMTNDIDTVVARGLEAGGRLKQPIQEIAGMKVAFIEDPEGGLIELAEFN